MVTRKPYPIDVSDEEWSFIAPYLTLIDEHAPQRHHDLVNCSTRCAGWCAPVSLGACCRPISCLGRRSTSKPSGGSRPADSKRSSATCARSCGWRKGVTDSRVRSCWMDARCNRRSRAVLAPDTTGTSENAAARYIGPSIRWAICWPCRSRSPMSRSSRKGKSWHSKCNTSVASKSGWLRSTNAMRVKCRARPLSRRDRSTRRQTARGQAVKKSRSTESQILAILMEGDSGIAVAEVCRKHGICNATTSCERWKDRLAAVPHGKH